MAQISFEAYQKYAEQRTAQQNATRIKYFSLKDDGNEAIVRIMHDSTADFDMCVIHEVKDGQYTKKINCLREAGEPFDNCPLCAIGAKVVSRIYIHLIEYTPDENGNIVATPKIWERSASYAATLRDYINEYGPLSDVIFKIKRNGKRGSQDTTYNITYCRPEVYRPDLYPKVDLFNGYKAVGAAVESLNFNQMDQLADKIDPDAAVYAPSAAVPKQEAAPAYAPAAPAAPTYSAPVYNQMPPQQAPTNIPPVNPPQEQTRPWETPRAPYGAVPQQDMGFRPKRTYNGN